MSLEGVFYVSVSLASIIVSVSLIMVIFYIAKLMRELEVINKKILEVAEEGKQVAEEAKDYVGKIGKSAIDYYVVKLLKSIKGKK